MSGTAKAKDDPLSSCALVRRTCSLPIVNSTVNVQTGANNRRSSGATVSEQIAASDELPPVWPDAEGKVRGLTLEPLHRAAPAAAKKVPVLYELLALVDALRDGESASGSLPRRN